MRQAWGEFLVSPKPRAHGAQVYAEPAELVESVAAFVAAGLAQGEPAVLVAVPERLRPLAAALDGAGWGLAAAQEAELLVVADAEETLDAVLDGGVPSAARFDPVIGGLLDVVQRPGRSVRVFGEMVDVLARRGDLAGAHELERLWNALAARRDFALLCGYGLDVFDHAAQAEALPHVCQEHSHLLPAGNYARFARAVDDALRDVLGPDEADWIFRRVSREAEAAVHVPFAELLLMWVTRNLPAASGRVLDAARGHYARA